MPRTIGVTHRLGATRLSRLHPYPAMVADELAIELSQQYVKPDFTVLDPFCGSGRLLSASAHLPGKRVGFDVNPLSCLISRAKLAAVDSQLLSGIAADGKSAQLKWRSVPPIDDVFGRKVAWYSEPVRRELAQIIEWIGSLQLAKPELLIAGACLSAAAREVSYARKSGWKLHRLSESDREIAPGLAWRSMLRRLRYCAAESGAPPLSVSASIEQVDCSALSVPGAWSGKADVVLTSPPYGDSRTTVQYGAASEICLHVVSHVRGLESYSTVSGAIDRLCLGGSGGLEDDRLSMFWSGKQGTREAAAAARFLGSLSKACGTIADVLKPGGNAIFVVGRRSTGGYRLRLDEFLNDEMQRRGFNFESLRRRALKDKWAPRHINRFARSQSEEVRASGIVPTMRDEIILSFSKVNPAAKRSGFTGSSVTLDGVPEFAVSSTGLPTVSAES